MQFLVFLKPLHWSVHAVTCHKRSLNSLSYDAVDVWFPWHHSFYRYWEYIASVHLSDMNELWKPESVLKLSFKFYFNHKIPLMFQDVCLCSKQQILKLTGFNYRIDISSYVCRLSVYNLTLFSASKSSCFLISSRVCLPEFLYFTIFHMKPESIWASSNVFLFYPLSRFEFRCRNLILPRCSLRRRQI